MRYGPPFTADLCDGFTPSALSSRALTLCLSSLGHQMVTDGVSGSFFFPAWGSFLPAGEHSCFVHREKTSSIGLEAWRGMGERAVRARKLWVGVGGTWESKML